MTGRTLLSLSLRPIGRRLQRWWINRQIAHIQFQIAHLQAQRANDFHVERVLMGRQAFLRAALLDL